jgi:Uma2 family endonuclease
MWPATLELVPEVDLPIIRKLTVEDYHAMARAGILREDERVELLGGQLLSMAPIGPEHQDVLEELNRAFLRQEDGSFRVGPGRPIPIPPHHEPQPDLVLYPAQARNWQAHPSAKDVLLVIEIADATRSRDLRVKRLLYQGAGIPEYWVVDLKGRAVWVFTLNAQGDYLERRVTEGPLRPAALPSVTVSVSGLFLG